MVQHSKVQLEQQLNLEYSGEYQLEDILSIMCGPLIVTVTLIGVKPMILESLFYIYVHILD